MIGSKLMMEYKIKEIVLVFILFDGLIKSWLTKLMQNYIQLNLMMIEMYIY